ncbi:hydantoinase B/oxoprolinase family protein [Natrialbaceae archaeon A-CW2]|uniref:hydantoinase B/oxoprolinase family protein n=1 Tax=Natronosalvus amylolyticus TaxID=2961994 RepID=UPI0020C953FE|nr:hydantoinase B/oxoprolinase family protein [Natronosalvus amylolyticus]
MADSSQNVDPVTLEVVRNASRALAEEMNATLVRTSYSPNIKERRDCSCAVFDSNGEMCSQAETMPVHLGAMPFSVRSALERFPPSTLEPGDAILVNDPFHGGAHLPDLTLVTPVFLDADDDEKDRPIGFTANRAHHADVGGARAGSVAADSTEIYQEGLRLPPVKLYEGGTLVEDVMEIILANVRTPDERRGDLRAQQAANETGRNRMQALAKRYGLETFETAVAAIQTYAERRMRHELEALPDGTYEFADRLDDDGQGNENVAIEATVTIDGDTVSVDFSGSAPQTPSAINAVFAVTASATYYAIRCLTDPEIPLNAGAYRPIEISAPAGTVVNAEPPAAVVGGNLEVSQRVTDVILGALAPVVPERAVAAGQGTMNNVTLGGTDPRDGRPYTFYETQAGGFGASASGDGMDGVHVHMSNTLNTPAEVLQTVYPLSVERYEYRPDTGGAGTHRGGLGLRRDIKVRGHEATCSLIGERRRHHPYGIQGGQPGSRGSDHLFRDGAERALEAKSSLTLEPGDVLSIRTPGGGGYGDPAERPRSKIERDIELEKVSLEMAREAYGHELEDSRPQNASNPE